jgi:TetR/AcrR family transcriptional repressor of nem operon
MNARRDESWLDRGDRPNAVSPQMSGLPSNCAAPGTGAAQRLTPRERAINLHCEMVGALVLSRSVAQAAPALSNEILENVRRDVFAYLNDRSSRSPKTAPEA